jgi:hypothetical protein
MTSRTRHVVVALALGMLPSTARAQGTLSTQGLGFPPGQLSTAARSMGGSIGEADPLSALNPAAVGLLTTAIVMMQAEPEYRQVRVGSRMQRSSVSRFPLFLGGLPLGRRWAIGISASTLLDRTWETTTRDSQFVPNGPITDTIAATLRERSEGSISDLRLALAFAPTPWLRIGIGGHAYSGRDVLETRRTFDDTLRFATDLEQTTIGFGGNAISGGVQTLWERRGAIGVSYRRGGSLRAYSGNVTVGSGSAPDHFGASVVYLGIAGTALSVRAARDSWSRLRGVAQTLNVHEGWDLGAGADVSGPRWGTSSPIGLRLGGRWRTLPFSAGTTPVKERTWSTGLGLPMARGRAEVNIGLLRASRTADAGVSETSWTLSTGFSVRP